MRSQDNKDFDVVVVGAGSAGIAAAVSASRSGARTLLIEGSSVVGGDMLSGLPFDGCLNLKGEWIAGGIVKELFERCERLGGYTGAIYDWRRLWIVCCDPVMVNLAVVSMLKQSNVSLLINCVAHGVNVRDGSLERVTIVNKGRCISVGASVFIDCTGDGDIATLSGAPSEMGGAQGELQPVGMVFRVCSVEPEPLLSFVRRHPENVSLGINPLINKTKEECAAELHKEGHPKVYFIADGPLLRNAIEKGEMYACHMVGVSPTSTARKEVAINSTKIANVDATRVENLSECLPILLDQVETCHRFLKKNVPGFGGSAISGLAPRIGVRETRRVMGDYVLTREDVSDVRQFDDSIAQGGHPIDLHREGTAHTMVELTSGGSYGIPYRCLLPRRLKNVLVAGRCLSSTREANGSSRVMGTCLATGQAAGTAAAISVQSRRDVRQIDPAHLRRVLKGLGAVVDAP